MDVKTEKKRGLAAIFALCPVRHIIALVSAGLILLHLVTRQNYRLMAKLSKNLVRPLHQFMAKSLDALPFSVAELLICAAATITLVYIIIQIIRIVTCKDKLKKVYITLMSLLSAVLAVYALFSMLWGIFFYGDDFMTSSGLENGKISTEQLETVTAYFAALTNEYADKVQRNEDGFYIADRAELLEKSPEVFLGLEKSFPCLEGAEVHVKGIRLSRALSYLDFTGFFFPFTAEANVNMDFPPSLFASTVAHELCHQRGVAKEQEANFVAVLASLDYGDADYCYSACLLAYTYLGNALYRADYEAWEKVYLSLDENVHRDFALNRAYWQQFETPVQTVSNTVYEGLLHSYDQELGLKSYGACVDLLVNYYYETAAEYMEKAA